jgi:hypothetical protein
MGEAVLGQGQVELALTVNPRTRRHNTLSKSSEPWLAFSVRSEPERRGVRET